METLMIADAHARAARFDREAARSATDMNRVNLQHISQPLSAVLARYGLLEQEDGQPGELPLFNVAAAGCETCLST